MAAITICSDFGAPKNKVCHCFHCFSICPEVMGPDAMILVFWMLSFKPTFSLSSLTCIKTLFSSPSLSAIRVVSSAYRRLLVFLPAILIPAIVVALGLTCSKACGNLSFPTREQTHIPCIDRQIRNHWTAGEVLRLFLFCMFSCMILLKRCSLTISSMKCWGRLGRFFAESCLVTPLGLEWGAILVGIRKESLTFFPRNISSRHACVQVSLCTWKKIISRVWVDFYFCPLLLSMHDSPVAFYGKLSPGPREAASHSCVHQPLRSEVSEARQQMTQTLLVTSLLWKKNTHTFT